LSQVWVVNPSLALEGWSKTLCKELKNEKMKEKDTENILHFLKSCLNESKKEKISFDVDSFLWIQENSFQFSDFKELYLNIKVKMISKLTILKGKNDLFK
jgi:hypothetical protein